MEKIFKNGFLKELFEVATAQDLNTSANQRNEKLMRAFLEFGSETECNLNCAAQIEYGLVTDQPYDPPQMYGLKLKNTNILISVIANWIENLDIPPEIQEDFPELTTQEWNAVTRMLTMLASALERSAIDTILG
ncbi:MAG TPA: hypothetical protein PLB32_10055 [Acidobacteriota bacterium]|nr:hypothetical protein [Acidobacteriota bacterium]HNG93130.1 hypothetical protein [Acidobacteriota bacterium]